MNRSLLTVLLALSAGVLTACQAPQGETGARRDPYRTTDDERGSTQASLPPLNEFTDQVAASFVAQLAQIPEIRDAQQQQVIELGTLLNNTRTPSSDFELFQRRLRSQLLRSDVAKRNFIFVENPQRMDSELQRLTGGAGTDGTGTTARYDPKIIYVLQGDFFEAVRGGSRQYLFNFKLVNLASRAIVFDEQVDLKQTTIEPTRW